MAQTPAPLVGDPRAFADALERTINARRLTPAEASRQIGCSTSLFSRWRRGTTSISIYWLEKVALWMDRPLAELLPLAGYPAVTPASDASTSDPDLQAIHAAWSRLPKHRRDTLVELAVGFREPRNHYRLERAGGLTPEGMGPLVDIIARRVDQTSGTRKRESQSTDSMKHKYGFQPVLSVLRWFLGPEILSLPTAGWGLRAVAAA